MKDLFSLEGKVAIVTGGSGMLGGEFVKTLRGAGAKVAVFDLKEGKSSDSGISYYIVDISKKESIESAVQDIKKKWGTPRVLVNAAAMDVPPSYASESGGGLFETKQMEEIYDKMMQVNVKGMLLCSQVVGNEMAAGSGGSIINIASIYGSISPDQRIYARKGKAGSFTKPIAYCISKSAVYNMTRYLATYWPGKNVRVNTLTFGGVFNNQDPEFVANYSSKVPLGRMAKRDEYNGAVLFLASDASSYMTGSDMVVDGGYMAW